MFFFLSNIHSSLLQIRNTLLINLTNNTKLLASLFMFSNNMLNFYARKGFRGEDIPMSLAVIWSNTEQARSTEVIPCTLTWQILWIFSLLYCQFQKGDRTQPYKVFRYSSITPTCTPFTPLQHVKNLKLEVCHAYLQLLNYNWTITFQGRGLANCSYVHVQQFSCAKKGFQDISGVLTFRSNSKYIFGSYGWLKRKGNLNIS